MVGINTPRACAGWLAERCTQACQQNWLYFHTPERERLTASQSTLLGFFGEKLAVILRCEGCLCTAFLPAIAAMPSAS